MISLQKSLVRHSHLRDQPGLAWPPNQFFPILNMKTDACVFLAHVPRNDGIYGASTGKVDRIPSTTSSWQHPTLRAYPTPDSRYAM
jgi:hypothetical protein